MYKNIYSQNSYDEEDEHKQWEEEQSQIKNPEYLSKYFEKQKVNKPKSPICKLNNEDGHSLLDGNLQCDHENDKNEADNDQAEESGEGEEYGSFFKGVDGDCKSEDWSGEQMKKINVTVNPTVSLPVPKRDQLSPNNNIVPPVPEQKLSENKDSENKVDNQLAESGSTSNSRRRDVCIKSILRSMRRYYCEKLENETIYVRKEKRIKFKHQLLIKCSYEIITKLGLDGFSENMAFYFALFSYSCDMRKILEKLKVNHGYLKGPCTCGKAESCVCSNYDADISNLNNGILIINLVENALNRFSKRIFTKLIEIPEISFMIQHFLQNNPDRHDTTKEYEECYRILDSRSKAIVLSHNKEQTKKEENDSPVLINIGESTNKRRTVKTSIPKNLWDAVPVGGRIGSKPSEYYIRKTFFTCLGPPKVA